MPTKKKILVADDEDYVTKYYQAVLFGYDITAAYDGEAAFSLLTKDNFDLVITDCNMPGKDGEWLVEEIKKHKLLVLVIMCSGQIDVMQRLFEKHGVGFITKPVDPYQLTQTVKEALNEPN